MWIDKWATVDVGLKFMWKEIASTSPADEQQEAKHLDPGSEVEEDREGEESKEKKEKNEEGGEETEFDTWFKASWGARGEERELDTWSEGPWVDGESGVEECDREENEEDRDPRSKAKRMWESWEK